ncbi:MAG: glycosyltransferase family 4 protein [Alphaproteobacteria bacterium]|nr:glycosyltransferase family 4 protein [Alphaproteobacteria bacterium]
MTAGRERGGAGDRPGTIMQVLPALEQGGVERGTIELARTLCAKNIPNIVVSSGGPMARALGKIGAEHITLPVQSKNPVVMALNAARLARLIRERGVSLVHVRSRAPAWSVKWACRWTQTPWVATYHGLYGVRPALKKWYNRVMLQGERVIAVSDFVRQHIGREYRVPADKIALIHRGADIDQFDPRQVPQRKVLALMQKYQIPPEKPIVVLVGRLSKIKGHGVLLDALRRMAHKELTILFVGSDQGRTGYTRELREKIKLLDGETDVRLAGGIADIAPVYALADVVVAPSVVPEAFGRTIVEAQAMGRIVVASDHGGARETIADGRTGFLFPNGDAAALARVLDHILGLSVAARRKIEQAGLRSVRNSFSVRKMCEKTIDLYEEVLHEKK